MTAHLKTSIMNYKNLKKDELVKLVAEMSEKVASLEQKAPKKAGGYTAWGHQKKAQSGKIDMQLETGEVKEKAQIIADCGLRGEARLSSHLDALRYKGHKFLEDGTTVQWIKPEDKE